MNWEGELLDLYEKNCSKAGVIEYKEYEKNGKKEEKKPQEKGADGGQFEQMTLAGLAG